MRDELAHRGPDAAGVWRSPDGRVCLGHRRLAIIDLRAEANQPWVSHDGRFVVTFNGEIYNFLRLREELERAGVRFRTRSDTEVLVEAYRAWGESCLARFSGMFAFALWDAVERRLFCARDRAGEKPFYYAVIDGAFVFGSELKAVVAWPRFRKRLDFRALADFLTFSFVPDPRTIWEGAHKLPPAHRLVVDVPVSGALRVAPPVPWWDLRFQPDSQVVDWTPRILSALTTAADEMSIADVPLGTFLSGGVDSSSVTAALSRAGHDVRSFTIGFAEAGHDERPWARRVAAQYHTEHTERLVEPADVDAVFDKMVWHFDEPFGDYSYLPTFYVSREARQAITVSLSGDGGDEVFAGYRKYQRLALREGWGWAMPRPVAAAGARLFSSTTPAFRTLQQYGAEPSAMLADSLVLGFPRQALLRDTRGELARAVRDYDSLDIVRAMLVRADPRQVGLINAMRYLDFKLTLGSGILVKVDRASMAVALEVRPVYLHRALLDVAVSIPPARLADRRQAKKVLKTALAGWLPRDLLHRRKMGFAVPLAHWLRGGMAKAFVDTERHTRLDDLFDPGLVSRLMSAHARGTADFTARIHSLVFLERWLRKWA